MTLNSTTVSAGDDALATDYNDLRKDVIEGAGDYGTTTGSSNAYILAMDAQITSYVEGMVIEFKSNFTNTGAATINVNSIGVKSFVDLEGAAVSSGAIPSGGIIRAVYNGTAFQITNVKVNPAGLLDSTFLAGEDITAGNAVYVETVATFAQATSVQDISKTTANTRVSFPAFGSGVSASTLKLSLKKFSSPAANLNIRIETDNAGSPSGTLVDVNATGAVTAASLTTSLADTTVTLGGSFTIPAGTKVHIVLFQGTYGSETISATNYYGVGYYTNNTTTRSIKIYSGTAWDSLYSSVGSTNLTLTGSSPQNNGNTNSLGLQILAINDVIVNTITKDVNCTATTAYIKNDAGTILDTMTFSGNVATPTKLIRFAPGVYFRVEVDSGGASYANRREQSPTAYPQVGTDISFTSNSLNGANDPVGNQNNSVLTINTGVATSVNNFPYTSSSLISDLVLSKTDSDYSYKVDWHGISSETVAAGIFPKITISGINANQTGITHATTYYLNATPGSIGTSAGANSKKIAKGVGTTKVNVIPLAL